MAITADRLALDLSALPWPAERFGAGFYLGRGNNGKPLLLVAPGLGNAVVPHVRYAASLILRLAGQAAPIRTVIQRAVTRACPSGRHPSAPRTG